MQGEEARIARETAGGKEPTPEQLREAEEQRNEQDYAPEAEAGSLRWPKMSSDQRNTWIARGAAAKAKLLVYLMDQHPTFKIRADQIVVDCERVEAENAIAFNDGQDRCWIGFAMIEAIELNPAFVVGTVAHELFGHNEFDRGFSISEELFREAVAIKRGIKPEDVVLTEDEWSRFNYFESEIASQVWEYDLYVASDETGQQNPLSSPEEYLGWLFDDLQGQWQPEVLQALIEGLHRRFVIDPNVSDTAAAFFARVATEKLGVTL